MQEKRTWVYLQSPSTYEMSPCTCGNHDTQWSEYAHHLWCQKCEKDFIPESNGIFDGPIMLNTAQMMGINFSYLDLLTHEVHVLDPYNNDVVCHDVEKVLHSGFIDLVLCHGGAMVGTARLAIQDMSLHEVRLTQDALDGIQTHLVLNPVDVQRFLLHCTLQSEGWVVQANADSARLSKYLLKEQLDAQMHVNAQASEGSQGACKI